MSQYRNQTRKPCTRPVGPWRYDCASRCRCKPTEKKASNPSHIRIRSNKAFSS